jgi:uncharacterized membrane protein YdjX (TVP38/TMEM64 family)
MRFGPAALVAALAIWVWSSGVLHHLTLEDLGRSRTMLRTFVAAHPVESIAAFGAVYAAGITLSLPVALILTLAGGFLFGPLEGGLVSALASAVGGTVIFLICRTALGDSLRKFAGPKVLKLRDAAHKDALGLMLTLRLVPMTPFWLINIGAAALDIPLRAFLIGSAIGGLPSSFIYAALGSGLGGVFDSGGAPTMQMLLQPRVLAPLAALAVLAVVPLGWKLLRARSGRAAGAP